MKELVATSCVNSIKWVWPQSQAQNNRLFGAEAWQKMTLAWFYSSMAAYFKSLLSQLFKVTGDNLHQEIFVSNKLFVSPQKKQL